MKWNNNQVTFVLLLPYIKLYFKSKVNNSTKSKHAVYPVTSRVRLVRVVGIRWCMAMESDYDESLECTLGHPAAKYFFDIIIYMY